MPRWRLLDELPVPARDATGQMQADLALLDSVAAGGAPALRLYRWAPPAISLGRLLMAEPSGPPRAQPLHGLLLAKLLQVTSREPGPAAA